jgi:Putative addiction module component
LVSCPFLLGRSRFPSSSQPRKVPQTPRNLIPSSRSFRSLAKRISGEHVEAAWAVEIERRARRFLAGESSGIEWVEARSQVLSSLDR